MYLELRKFTKLNAFYSEKDAIVKKTFFNTYGPILKHYIASKTQKHLETTRNQHETRFSSFMLWLDVIWNQLGPCRISFNINATFSHNMRCAKWIAICLIKPLVAPLSVCFCRYRKIDCRWSSKLSIFEWPTFTNSVVMSTHNVLNFWFCKNESLMQKPHVSICSLYHYVFQPLKIYVPPCPIGCLWSVT